MLNLYTLSILGYLIGSVSFAIVIAKLFKLTDPRDVGSKNPGATNILRYGGAKLAAATLAGDAAKGFFPVLLCLQIELDKVDTIIVALCILLGHIFPIFFRFKGDKGVATFVGITGALNLYILAVFCLTWLLIAKVSKYSSLAAIVSTLTAAIISYFLENSVPFFCVYLLMSGIVIARHKTNMKNIRTGNERKIGEKENNKEQT